MLFIKKLDKYSIISIFSNVKYLTYFSIFSNVKYVLNIYIYIHVYACMFIYVYMYLCTCMFIHTCKYIYIYLYIYIHIHVSIYIDILICIYSHTQIYGLIIPFMFRSKKLVVIMILELWNHNKYLWLSGTGQQISALCERDIVFRNIHHLSFL